MQGTGHQSASPSETTKHTGITPTHLLCVGKVMQQQGQQLLLLLGQMLVQGGVNFLDLHARSWIICHMQGGENFLMPHINGAAPGLGPRLQSSPLSKLLMRLVLGRERLQTPLALPLDGAV